MNKLKKKLKNSACVGFRSHKEDCNISNFSEGQTVDSGIVSDQSSRQENQKSNISSEWFIDKSKFLSNFSYQQTKSNENSKELSHMHNQSKNLSPIKENKIVSPLSKRNKINYPVDFGPFHPYMNAIPFYSYQYSDAYNTVASDDSQSIISELFIPVNRTTRKFKNDGKKKEKNINNQGLLSHFNDKQRWDRLPSKILIQIFKQLSIHDIGQCAQVCINWYFIAWQPVLWDIVDFSPYAQHYKSIDINKIARNILSLLGGIKNPMCPLVHTIKLDKCSTINDDSLILISNSCQNLKILSVKKCYLISNIAIFHILSKCKSLDKLNVEGCKLISSINTLPDFDPTETHLLPLNDLNISNCPLIDDASLSILTYKFCNLKKLIIRNCKRVTNIGLEYIARYCSHINELSLNKLTKIDDEAVISISLKINDNLHYLSLANCTSITDSTLNHLSDNTQHLRYLNLHKCRLITDSGVMSLAISMQSSMISLSLSYCERITNKSLSVISRYCSKIQQLDLSHCVNISDEGLEEACNYFKSINLINIDNTSATVKSYDYISSMFPKCTILHNFITDC